MSTIARNTYLAARAVSVEASIRTRMLRLASGMTDLISLGRGDPDLDSPGAVVQADDLGLG